MRGVSKTADLLRIIDLPRRSLASIDEDLVFLLTDAYKTDTGTMTLRPIQALALSEFHDNQGLLGSMPVGSGKTLVSFLAPVVANSKRPLLLIPAKLANKTIKEFEELAKHWKSVPIKIMNYELLSRERGMQELNDYKPDCIVMDECHRAKNTKAAVTKRLKRYIKQHNPTVAAISGTITRKSIKDYWHILEWTHGDNKPLPNKWNEMADWSNALDEDVLPWARLAPGKLDMLCDEEELAAIAANPKKPLAAIRSAYRRRLGDTPGVITLNTKSVESSLLVEQVLFKHTSSVVLDAFKHLRESWESPDGYAFSQAVDLWRTARQLACGFYYKWDPRPPQEWLDCRREWASFARKILGNNRRGIDSELQLVNACDRGEYSNVELEAWRFTKETFKPNVVPVWLDLSVIEYATKWLTKNKGIVWVEHVSVGEKISEVSGFSYFGESGKSSERERIEQARGPIIASISANGEGRNLQAWDKNLVISCPPSGATWEQLLGRTHRQGQESDSVTYQVFISCIELWTGYEKAKRDALYIQDTTGQSQKLLSCDKDEITEDKIKSLIKSKNNAWGK